LIKKPCRAAPLLRRTDQTPSHTLQEPTPWVAHSNNPSPPAKPAVLDLNALTPAGQTSQGVLGSPGVG
jgi:hypothetical protein